MWLYYFNYFLKKLFFVDYMVEKLGIERSKFDVLSNLLYKNYGIIMVGLRVGFIIYVIVLCFFKKLWILNY